MTQQKIISSYIRQAKKNCPFSFRKKLGIYLKNHLCDYFDDHPNSTFNDITNRLGPPEKFADEYLLYTDETTRKKILQKTKWFKRSILIGITAIVLIWTVIATGILIEISKKRVHYYYEYVTESSTT